MFGQMRSWPELVGMNGNEAVARIKRESGLRDVHALSLNSPVTMDLRSDRVRVFVDAAGNVASPPSVG